MAQLLLNQPEVPSAGLVQMAGVRVAQRVDGIMRAQSGLLCAALEGLLQRPGRNVALSIPSWEQMVSGFFIRSSLLVTNP